MLVPRIRSIPLVLLAAVSVAIPVRASSAELSLALAEETRLGAPSTLFSQMSASASEPLRAGAGGAAPNARVTADPPEAGAFEVVLEPGRDEVDAARLAEEQGLDLTGTRRDVAGAVVATVRPPAAADPEKVGEARRVLEAAPEVTSVRDAPIESAETPGAEQAPIEDLPPVELEAVGLPVRFYLGMLTSVGLLVAAGLLWWSASREVGGS